MECVTQVVTLLSAGLAGLTRSSRAQAVEALSRLLYEHSAKTSGGRKEEADSPPADSSSRFLGWGPVSVSGPSREKPRHPEVRVYRGGGRGDTDGGKLSRALPGSPTSCRTVSSPSCCCSSRTRTRRSGGPR